MNRKKIICILTASVILFCCAMVVLIKNAGAISMKRTGLDTDVSYYGSVGGAPLPDSDPDHVEVNAKGYDISAVVATDDLGRTLPSNGKGDNGRQVALFYSLWHDGDNGTLLFTDYLGTDTPLIFGQYYWWAKPLFDFYLSDDSWVTRRHIEMFIYADVDYLVIDATNGSAYTTKLLKLMRLLHEYNEAGWDAPKVVLYTNSRAEETVMSAYTSVYSINKYPDTWYMVDGKPLVITPEVNETISRFFTVRPAQWPNHTGERVTGGYPWIDFNDKADVYYDANGKHGVIPVSVAQNSSPNAWFSDNLFYGMTGDTGGSRGRSWHNGADNITEDSYKYGYNFQEEWDNAIASDAETAMVLQWNEWIAGVHNINGKTAIYDQLTPEFSRDIEPMTGGHFDNYYMQLVINIRRFKNTGSSVPVRKENDTIDISGAFGQWNGTGTTYIDIAGSTERRDSESYAPYRLTDSTGRNNMLCAKVAKDGDNIYFYVQTNGDISEDKAGTWMNLYIDMDGDLLNNWNGYEYRINGVSSGEKLRLEKYSGSSFGQTAEVPYRIRGNQMMLCVAKSALGISGNTYTVYFKWADSVSELETREDFYKYGDTMPYGRFNYAFSAGK